MPKLNVIQGPMKGQTYDLYEETLFVGRSYKNDIQIKDNSVSRKQLKIFRIGNNILSRI